MAEKNEILAVIGAYVNAVNAADADRLEALFWYNDARFSEVENHIALPFSKEVFLDIGNWIRQNAEPGVKQRFFDTSIYLLSDDIAYSVSLREQFETGKISRITLIYLKKDNEWKIIHGHFSLAPDPS